MPTNVNIHSIPQRAKRKLKILSLCFICDKKSQTLRISHHSFIIQINMTLLLSFSSALISFIAACMCPKQVDVLVSVSCPIVTHPKMIATQTKNIISVRSSESYLDGSARYSMVANGSDCERVTSKEKCEDAARHLNVSDITAKEETEDNFPPFCYFYNKKEETLYFNKSNLTNSECNSHHICICKEALGILGS